jgi:hypothetical protein
LLAWHAAIAQFAAAQKLWEALMLTRISGFILFGAIAMGTAHANDSTGHLAAGGLVLGKTDAIEMQSEELFISEKEIRVRYHFFNKTGADVKTQVGFPMPDVPPRSDEDNYELPLENPANFLDFSTKVNGKPVTMQMDQQAIAGGVNHAAVLRTLHVPLANFQDTTAKALRALPREEQTKLVSLGLAREDEYDIGQGMQKYLEPNWTLRTTYHWEQVFPAQKELVIEHRYRPAVGSTAGSFVSAGQPEPDVLAGYKDRYCVDDDFLNAASRTSKTVAANNGYLTERRLEYVLVTGANWAGPIKDFRLVVDKGAPANLVSFCGTGVKKIGPTQFEMHATDFTPKQNLNVLILMQGQSD